MANQAAMKPWHEVVELREDLKSGDLSLAVFAADLYDVIMQKGRRPVYEDPEQFFSFSFPTLNLRELVKDVCLRLAGRTDRAYRKLSVNYGGGKTHSLITLWHLVREGVSLPDLPAIREFEAHSGLKPPQARVAALCFDKIDLEVGVETVAPDGTIRMLKHPWSVLAFQLAGDEGLKMIHANGLDEERETPPAEPLMVDLLSKPHEDGLATLVLLDEVLLYLRGLKAKDPSATTLLVNFFQYLTQAVVKVDRCAMVASLLASDHATDDDFRGEFGGIHEVFGRQMEEEVSPVSKDDVAEVLRRRFFKPESIKSHEGFRPHVARAVGNIANMDEQTLKERQSAEERFLSSYPFHPNLTDLFYDRWTQVYGFQRTRGILRTFAIALRDACHWDTSPLIGPNVFLSQEGQGDLSEAAAELASVASAQEDATGTHQQWQPILEGELAKARVVQSQDTKLRHRELEQTVMSVFLSSLPIGQKAQTRELNVLIGATGPDRIELEKALVRWTEVSWFLDEVEVGSASTNPDGSRQLPAAWRLGNRPNLRQMHDDACENRVQPAQVETRLLQRIRQLGPLTSQASAAGARVHNLPERSQDIADDGEFHYAVLGPSAASESGKPSSEAKCFIDETTGPDRPRANRNAIVLAVPSRDGLERARNRIREHLGWLEVKASLDSQSVEIDPFRAQVLADETEAASKKIPDAIRQAYSIVVAVNETNDIHAFRVAVSSDPLFVTIKGDARARIQETAISAEAMLPDGPYGLWQSDEAFRRVNDLVGAFAQFTKLPKMLRQKEIRDTVAQGVADGIWVARLMRPDRTVKTFWRIAVDEEIMRDPALEVFLPESTSLSDLDPRLLQYNVLPGLWTATEITVQHVVDYFANGQLVPVPRDGYDDIVSIPKCEADLVEQAIEEAVQRGLLWLTNGLASMFAEAVPPGVLTQNATLQSPPEALPPQDLVATAVPAAWKDNRANLSVISDVLSHQMGKPLPWSIVKSAIDAGIQARWFELSPDSGPWPCDLAGARNVVIQAPEKAPMPPPPPPPPGVVKAEAALEANGIQDLADHVDEIVMAAVGNNLRFSVRIELGGQNVVPSNVVDEINALLAKISDDLQLR